MTEEGCARILAFATERHRTYLRRSAGEPWPWTQDPILQAYRFCNLYRELDTTTLWLRENWFAPNSLDPDLWFAAAVARHVNKVSTLAQMPYPVPWEPERFKFTIESIMSSGGTAYSSAYMVRAESVPGLQTASKSDYLAKVLTAMWVRRAELRPRDDAVDNLEAFWSRLRDCHGLGSFMAAQVVADAKFHGVLSRAQDWWTFAAPGPGSQRGLNRVLGRGVSDPWRLEDWRAENERLRVFLDFAAIEAGMPAISGQDCNNICCEFDKYERARLGQGRPKQIFRSRK